MENTERKIIEVTAVLVRQMSEMEKRQFLAYAEGMLAKAEMQEKPA